MPKGAIDLIGFDPRGIGNSTPVTCGIPDDVAVNLAFDEGEISADQIAAVTTVSLDGHFGRVVNTADLV